MTLYRVLKPLQTKRGVVPQGDFITGASYSPESLAKLEEVGAISVLHAPPLNELPGFDGAEQLAAIGIVNADQLLEEKSDVILDRLGIDAATLRNWRIDVAEWLIIPARAASG